MFCIEDEFGPLFLACDKVAIDLMDPLEASIKKWEFVVENLPKFPGLKCGSGSTCALCRAYGGDSCDMCPVFADTGMAQCDFTPWIDWCAAQTPEEKLDAAKREVEYLKGLRCQN